MAQRVAFRAFLERIIAGKLTVPDWNAHIITRYADAELEMARKQLAQHAVLCGQCSVQPSSAGLDDLAQTLLQELR